MERIKKYKKKFNERLFLALKLPLETKREINNILKSFTKEGRNFEFVEPDQLHLTLKFIGGDISQSSINLLIEAVKPIINSIKIGEVPIDTLKFGFPKQTIPKILYFNASNNDELTDLVTKMNRSIRKLDLHDVFNIIVGKKNIFHITVGRIKHSSNRHYKLKIINLINDINFKPFIFSSEKVFLIKSSVVNKKLKYTDICTFDFKK